MHVFSTSLNYIYIVADYSEFFVCLGEYEHSYSSYVKGVQLEQCYGWPNSVLFFLGLSAHSGSFLFQALL